MQRIMTQALILAVVGMFNACGNDDGSGDTPPGDASDSTDVGDATGPDFDAAMDAADEDGASTVDGVANDAHPGDAGPDTVEPALCESLCAGIGGTGMCPFPADADCEAWCETATAGSCGGAHEAHFACLAGQELECGASGPEPTTEGACGLTLDGVSVCEIEQGCAATCAEVDALPCADSLPAAGCQASCREILSGPCDLHYQALIGCNGDSGWSCDELGNVVPGSGDDCAAQANDYAACDGHQRCVATCADASTLSCAPWSDDAACVAECDTINASCYLELRDALACNGDGGYVCDEETQALWPANLTTCPEAYAALGECVLPVTGPSCPEYCAETEALLCRVKDGEIPIPDVPACTEACLGWKTGSCSAEFNAVLSCNGDAGFFCLQDQPTPSEIVQCSALYWAFEDCLAVSACGPVCDEMSAQLGDQGCGDVAAAASCLATCEEQLAGTADCSEDYAAYFTCLSDAPVFACTVEDPAGWTATGCEGVWAAYATCAGS